MTGEKVQIVRIPIDPANPGQFFASCGLLELAGRFWGRAEAWFDDAGRSFCLNTAAEDQAPLSSLVHRLVEAEMVGALTPELEAELDQLEREKRDCRKQGRDLPVEKEQRRKELGTLQRSGAIRIGGPFNLLLDWWQEEGVASPKTWAGRQEVYRIAKAALVECTQAFNEPNPFDYACVLRAPGASPASAEEPTKLASESGESAGKVEPFYFDARRGSHALPLDIGFSPDTLKLTSAAYPAVELLCLVGLQRFRPVPIQGTRHFDYCTWKWPLPLVVAPLAAAGVIESAALARYRFENAFRTDQKKHKGFRTARQVYNQTGEEANDRSI